MNEQVESLVPEPTARPKVLAVLREEKVYRDLAGSGHEEIALDFHPTIDSASRFLAEGEPPSALLTDLTFANRNGLELLGELDTRGIRIPVLVLTPGPGPVRVEQDHPFLTVLPQVSRQGLVRVVSEATQRASVAPDGPMFRVLDYLRLALELKQSVILKLHLAASIELRLDILGGDLWNAYADTEGGFRVLSMLAAESPKSVATSQFQRLPSERQIHKSPREILRGLSAAIANSPTKSPTKSRRYAPETQPLDLTEFVTSAAPATKPPVAPIEPDAGAAVREDEYKVAIANGIDAALQRDFASAIEAFERALAARPGDRQALYNLKRIRGREERR